MSSRNPTKALCRAPSTHTIHEIGARIRTKAIPPIRANTLTLPLRLVDVILELLGARVDELELSKLSIEDADDLCEWVVGFACLAEGLGRAVDLLDHLGEIFVEFVETVLEFLCELVTVCFVSELVRMRRG
jgi:hypothetical protein